MDLEVHQVMSKIKGYIITLTQFPTPEWAITHSKSCTDKLIKSIKDTQTEIEPIVFRATEYKSLKEDLKLITYIDTSNLEYTYPMLHEGRERITGLYMMPPAPHEDVRFRIACMISHMRLWQKCIDMDEPIVVLEHDAIFTHKFKKEYILEHKDFLGGVCGLNTPIRATREDKHYAILLNELGYGIHTVPSILHPDGVVDGKEIPSGLPGNSSYIITPLAAKALLKKTKEVGMWPNDVVMCKQLMGDWVQIAHPHFSEIQTHNSSTTQIQ